MKIFLLPTLLILASLTAATQDITGQWNGLLKIQEGVQLRLVFHISKTESGYASTMDSPDQGAKGLPVNSTKFENNTLNLEATALGMTYTGTLSSGVIEGTFMQRGMSLPLKLTREEVMAAKPNRPQEPKPPFPYYTEDVTFSNDEAKVQLAGTLTLPSKTGKFPVVVMISGSGPQNRDEELLGHKPFLVIADFLTRNGIGVLRFDDRGTAKSTGDFKSATSADHASDALSAVAYLKTRSEINPKKIGLVGHSEGGLIAPMAAVKSKDVAYIVLLAGPGIPGHEILTLQTGLINKANGMSEEKLKIELDQLKGAMDIVRYTKDLNDMKSKLTEFIKEEIKKHPESVPQGQTEEALIMSNVESLATLWMQFFLNYDPAMNLTRVKCPVLALNGEKDLQVPPKEDLGAIEKYLKQAGNKHFTTKEMPGLNHLFQECKTGSPSEYAVIEQTFAPSALEEISGWILKIASGKR